MASLLKSWGTGRRSNSPSDDVDVKDGTTDEKQRGEDVEIVEANDADAELVSGMLSLEEGTPYHSYCATFSR